MRVLVPILVHAHFAQLLRAADPIPDEIVAAMTEPQVVVQSGDGIADDLLPLRQEEREVRENAFARLRPEIGFVRRAAPDVIAGIDRLDRGRDLDAHARADAVAADEDIGALAASAGEMHDDAGAVLLHALEGVAEMVSRRSRCSRSHEVRICGRYFSAITRPSRSRAMRFSTSTPRSRVPAPLARSASSNSGWVVIPAPRPTSSTVERS